MMRLSQSEQQSINDVFSAVFEHGSLYLFGSRVDDTKKGGDIDLYIEPQERLQLGKKKIAFLVALKQRIGDRKIDVVIDRGSERLIDAVAKKEGVLLCQC